MKLQCNNEAKGREPHFDFLRVAATFAVISIHVSGLNWNILDVNSFEWQVINFYHSGVVRWAVPCFVMMSGALFLRKDKKIPLRRIYSKYIFRILTAFCFWSLVYSVAGYLDKGSNIFISFIDGHYHLWFLFMIIGLYMVIPFMKKIAASDFLIKYFLVLALIFIFVTPQPLMILSLLSKKYAMISGLIMSKFYVRSFIGGYSSYFLLGYFLDNTYISPKIERIIYAAGLLGFLASILMSSEVSLLIGKQHGAFFDNFNLNIFCESVAIFVFFKKHFTSENKFIRALSQYSFGAYLVHEAVIGLIRRSDLDTLAFINPIFSVPVISFFVFIASFTISGIINQIPILKKYVV